MIALLITGLCAYSLIAGIVTGLLGADDIHPLGALFMGIFWPISLVVIAIIGLAW